MEQRRTGREGGSENSKVVSHREGNWKERRGRLPRPPVFTHCHACAVAIAT